MVVATRIGSVGSWQFASGQRGELGSTSASQSSSSSAPTLHRLALALHGRLVAAGTGPVRACSAPRAAQFSTVWRASGASFAADPRAGGHLLRRRLYRHQEVGSDRGRGVVGGPVGVASSNGRIPRHRARRRRPRATRRRAADSRSRSPRTGPSRRARRSGAGCRPNAPRAGAASVERRSTRMADQRGGGRPARWRLPRSAASGTHRRTASTPSGTRGVAAERSHIPTPAGRRGRLADRHGAEGTRPMTATRPGAAQGVGGGPFQFPWEMPSVAKAERFESGPRG